MPRQNPRPPFQHRIRQHLVGVDGKGRGGGKGKEKSEDCAQKERPPLASRPSPPQGGRDRAAPARTISNVESSSMFAEVRREEATVPPPGLSPLVGEMGGSPEGVLRQSTTRSYGKPLIPPSSRTINACPNPSEDRKRPPLACRPSPPQGGRDRAAPARPISTIESNSVSSSVELNSIFAALRREGATVPPPGLSPLVGEMGGSPEGVLRQIDAFAFGTPNGLIARHAPHPAHSAAAARGRAARRAGAPMRRRRSLKDTAPPSIISTAPPQIARITGFHQSRTTIPPSGRSSPSET